MHRPLVIAAVCLLAACQLDSVFAGNAPYDKTNFDDVFNALNAWSATGTVRTRVARFLVHVEQQQVPVVKRVATFDMDGTLSLEKPEYMEWSVGHFHLCERAAADPSLMKLFPFSAACPINGTLPPAIADVVKLEAYHTFAEDFTIQDMARLLTLPTFLHPRYGMTWSQLFYTPMMQLMKVLARHQFTIYVVSGSQQSLIRAAIQVGPVGRVTREYQTIDITRAVGTRLAYYLGYNTTTDPSPALKLLRYNFTEGPENVGEEKPRNIEKHIGQPPLFAAGNTVGDLYMCRMVDGNVLTMPNGVEVRGLAMLVDHDDPAREYNYTFMASDLGKEATAKNWLVASINRDFAYLFDPVPEKPDDGSRSTHVWLFVVIAVCALILGAMLFVAWRRNKKLKEEEEATAAYHSFSPREESDNGSINLRP